MHAGMIIGAMLLSGIFIPVTAMAAKSVSFDQYTYEIVPGNSQSSRGVDASVKCPDGSTVSGPLFDFSANRERTGTSGSWKMIAAPGAAAGDGGRIEIVRLPDNNFKLKGTWEILPGRESAVICYGASVPATVVIKGECGIGVVVHFKASNGVTGKFKGDVTCN